MSRRKTYFAPEGCNGLLVGRFVHNSLKLVRGNTRDKFCKSKGLKVDEIAQNLEEEDKRDSLRAQKYD